MFRIDVRYNQGQGRLISDTATLAAKDLEWYRTFPADAFAAIGLALDALNPVAQTDVNDIANIRQKLAIARHLNHDVTLAWAGDTVTASLSGVGEVGECDFEEDDGRYWLSWVETNAQYLRQGIGATLIQAGVTQYGAIYASSASQQMHQDQDENDTRYLTQDGAALVNSCIARGIMQQGWLLNPFFEDDHNEDEDM